MKSERVFITRQQADELMPPGERVHTFMQAPGAGLILIGADHTRESILKLAEAGQVEIAGPKARQMKHGIYVSDKPYGFFVETNDDHPLLNEHEQ